MRNLLCTVSCKLLILKENRNIYIGGEAPLCKLGPSRMRRKLSQREQRFSAITAPMAWNYRARRAIHTEERSPNVSHSRCSSGFTLARRILHPACQQLPHPPAAPLCSDLHHHELCRRPASSLDCTRMQSKGRTHWVRPSSSPANAFIDEPQVEEDRSHCQAAP
jgi:hypothetical protein